MELPPPLAPLLMGAPVVHFPRLRMHQPFWPYSSASCRLSCSIRHAGIPAGAFHVCHHPSVPSHGPVRDLVPRLHRAPYSSAIPVVSNTSRFGTTRLHARSRVPVCEPCRTLPRRAYGRGMPPITPAVLTATPAQPQATKSHFQSAGAPGASFASLMILRSGPAPLQETNNHRYLVRQFLSVII